MSTINSIISTMTSCPITVGSMIGASFAAAIMAIQTFQTFQIQEQKKRISIKEHNINANLYSIVDQENNRYLIDKDVFNSGYDHRADDEYIIEYNKNTQVITKLSPTINWNRAPTINWKALEENIQSPKWWEELMLKTSSSSSQTK